MFCLRVFFFFPCFFVVLVCLWWLLFGFWCVGGVCLVIVVFVNFLCV